MLKFNLEPLFALRNITKKQNLLRKQGISLYSAIHIINGTIHKISLVDIERLCLAFNCTPNDLFDFTPSENSKLPSDHPLHSLTKQPLPNVKALMETLPYEKARELISRIDEFKKSDE